MIGPIGSFPIQCFIYSLACESHIYTDGDQNGDEDRTRDEHMESEFLHFEVFQARS